MDVAAIIWVQPEIIASSHVRLNQNFCIILKGLVCKIYIFSQIFHKTVLYNVSPMFMRLTSFVSTSLSTAAFNSCKEQRQALQVLESLLQQDHSIHCMSRSQSPLQSVWLHFHLKQIYYDEIRWTLLYAAQIPRI